MITRKITTSFTIPVGYEWERVDNADGSITITCYRYDEVKEKYRYKSHPTKRWSDCVLLDVLSRRRAGVTVAALAEEFDVAPSRMKTILGRASAVEYRLKSA